MRGVEGRAGCIDPGSTDLFTTFAALGQQTRARSHLALDTGHDLAVEMELHTFTLQSARRGRVWPRHRRSFVLESQRNKPPLRAFITKVPVSEEHYYVRTIYFSWNLYISLG